MVKFGITVFTSHHHSELPNLKIVYYDFQLRKMFDVEKSRFHVTKMLKMNIMKHSTKNTELMIPL
jgi:hypothetical protein